MTEILAPAGNMEMLKAAVINGADAVYVGMPKFSARAKAANFDDEQLKEGIDYAHLYGVKVYVAINTVIKNDELNDALSAAKQALLSNADALIVQDLGLAELIRKVCPNAILHASTQMGIHNLEGAIVAKKLGFSRIILSREALIEDIVKIKKNVDIEVECFVQGALCIAFSGNCYFSSFASGYSGNRGKCMQLCRKEYSAVVDGKTVKGYLLSAKDLMLAKRINELVDAGVDCFKIEGRLRRPEYVAEAVRVYKKALHGSFENNDLISLKKVFNRGDYTEGHLFNGTNKVLDINIGTHKGVYFGKVLKVQGKSATISSPLYKGDGIKFLRNGKEIGSASIIKTGNVTGFMGNVAVGDEVYITTDERLNNRIMARERKLPINIEIDFDLQIIKLFQGQIAITESIENVLPAENLPITENDIKDNFNRSENFYVSSICMVGKPSFMRKADLNALRRKAYDELRAQILKEYCAKMQKFTQKSLFMSDIINNDIEELLNGQQIFQVSDVEQITNYNDMAIIAVNPREYSVEFLSKFKDYYSRSILNLPYIARGKDLDILKEIIDKCNFAGYIVNNLYGLELVKNKPKILGCGMNIVNDVLNLPKIYSIECDTVMKNGYVYAQGNFPLMHFCHCEKKELSKGCAKCHGYDITLSYKKMDFKIRRYKIYYCYGQLLNCANLNILKKDMKKVVIDYSYERAHSDTKGNYGRGLK